MAEDFGLLAAELERCFGGTGTMPTRAQLRAITRTDLEKAMVAHGGPAAVAKRMGWKLAYKVTPLVCLYRACVVRGSTCLWQ